MEITETRLVVEPTSSSSSSSSSDNSVLGLEPSDVVGPEKKLTLFAFRLAFLGKVSTWLGSLAFISATVVLLGGFAYLLSSDDIWFISVILVIEGTRLYSRSHELELKTQSTYNAGGSKNIRALASCSGFLVKQVTETFLGVGGDPTEKTDQRRSGDQKTSSKLTRTRTWKRSDIPVLPYTGLVFVSRNMSRLFNGLQLLSAVACIVLSSIRLIHPYSKYENRNLPHFLTTFYALAFVEALLFLVEKAYWEWKVRVSKILENVNEDCGLVKFGIGPVTRFFHETYLRCINGSVFDGMDMDLISFATELLESDSSNEQLIGAEILCAFLENDNYSDDTLQTIEVNSSIVERLLEMLNWKNLRYRQLRLAAAEILSKLASKHRNKLIVSGFLGAFESISSLLESTRSLSKATDEIGDEIICRDQKSSISWTFNNLGLLILKRLARDHNNCGKIGKTRGLISKIIDFTHAEKRVLENSNAAESQILAVKRSLKLIKKLVSSTGTMGKSLRRDISSVVFTTCNIREILRHGERHSDLQKLGTEILTFLSLDEGASERIGGTGGILKELVCIFLKDDIAENRRDIRVSTGDAIAMLAQGSRNNCHQILKLNVIPGLLRALDKPRVRSSAARILRNLCAYTAPEFHEQLEEVKSAGVWVFKAITSEEDKILEVMVGLAPHILRLMSSEESRTAFKNASVSEEEVAEELVKILEKYKYPSSRVPRIRRFAIELTIQMMETSPETVKTFRDLGMKTELETVSVTTTELENFDIFSGTVGIARHGSSINELVEAALQLLATR